MDVPELKARDSGDSEQRAEARNSLRNVRETRRCPGEFEVRYIPNGTGGDDVVFTGMACVTDYEYEMEDMLGPWVESVSKGAFTKTLSEGADVAFLVNHEGLTLARTRSGTMKLREVTDGNLTGLQCEARLDPKNPYVQALRSAVDRGDIDSLSFAFRVTRQEWSENYDRRWINEVNLNLGDCSAVNYPANDGTAGTAGIRSARPVDWRGVCEALVEARAGKVLSAAHMDKLQVAAVHLGDSDSAAAKAAIQSVIDAAQSGASGNTGTQSADELPEKASSSALAEADLVLRRNREAEKKRRKAA